jgi:hypothetical protein
VKALAALVAAATVAGAVPPAPPVLRAGDSGKTFRLVRGREVLLRLSHVTWRWSDVAVSTRAVKLTRTVFIRDPGYDQWLVRGVTNGRAGISATGQIPCRTSPCPPTPIRLFRVTIVVR